VLRAVAAESLIVCIVASLLAEGHELSDEDRLRLITASSRLLAAVDAAGLDEEGERLRRILVKHRAAVIDIAANV
jgi:hypothetical protein